MVSFRKASMQGTIPAVFMAIRFSHNLPIATAMLSPTPMEVDLRNGPISGQPHPEQHGDKGDDDTGGFTFFVEGGGPPLKRAGRTHGLFDLMPPMPPTIGQHESVVTKGGSDPFEDLFTSASVAIEPHVEEIQISMPDGMFHMTSPGGAGGPQLDELLMGSHGGSGPRQFGPLGGNPFDELFGSLMKDIERHDAPPQCEADVKATNCSHAKSNLHCLSEHADKLRDVCQQALRKSVRFHCGSFIQGFCDTLEDSVVVCLSKHKSELTGTCKDSFLVAEAARDHAVTLAKEKAEKAKDQNQVQSVGGDVNATDTTSAALGGAEVWGKAAMLQSREFLTNVFSVALATRFRMIMLLVGLLVASLVISRRRRAKSDLAAARAREHDADGQKMHRINA
eukprot:TRINITY_DN63073_c0_g1_i1.p1 TRINITY_DN63073_c0_g1~~TRINITY_DN63073_c0_g1_i1.p1  ORF type:complete len:423 (-),score=74.12 TRINITY_DN63073_c0_g1_i1:96-1277(-)